MGDRDNDAEWDTWATDDGGVIDVEVDDDRLLRAGYDGPTQVTRAKVERLLGGWGVDVASLSSGPSEYAPHGAGGFSQQVAGVTVGWMSGAFASWDEDDGDWHLIVGAFFDLSAQGPFVDEATMLTTAAAFARCALDERGHTAQAGYVLGNATAFWSAVVHDSAARVMIVDVTAPTRGHCGNPREWVYIDVVTGAVLRSHEDYCLA